MHLAKSRTNTFPFIIECDKKSIYLRSKKLWHCHEQIYKMTSFLRMAGIETGLADCLAKHKNQNHFVGNIPLIGPAQKDECILLLNLSFPLQ